MIWALTIYAFLATAFIAVAVLEAFSRRHEIWEGLRKAQLERDKVSGVRRQAADELRTHGQIQPFQCPRNAYARRLGE